MKVDIKTCTVCNNEKHINTFYKKYSECKDCNIKRGVKRYFDKKDEISIQKKYFMKTNEINYYRNKMITETKETQMLKDYKDPMLNYQIN